MTQVLTGCGESVVRGVPWTEFVVRGVPCIKFVPRPVKTCFGEI